MMDFRRGAIDVPDDFGASLAESPLVLPAGLMNAPLPPLPFDLSQPPPLSLLDPTYAMPAPPAPEALPSLTAGCTSQSRVDAFVRVANVSGATVRQGAAMTSAVVGELPFGAVVKVWRVCELETSGKARAEISGQGWVTANCLLSVDADAGLVPDDGAAARAHWRRVLALLGDEPVGASAADIHRCEEAARLARERWQDASREGIEALCLALSARPRDAALRAQRARACARAARSAAAAGDASLSGALAAAAARDAGRAVELAKANGEDPRALAKCNLPVRASLIAAGDAGLLEGDESERVRVGPATHRGPAATGAFAAKAIKAETFLGCFRGEAIARDELQRRYGGAPPRGVLRVSDDLFLDASTGDHFTRHVAATVAGANVVVVAHGRAVAFYAARDLEAGEELLFDAAAPAAASPAATQ